MTFLFALLLSSPAQARLDYVRITSDDETDCAYFFENVETWGRHRMTEIASFLQIFAKLPKVWSGRDSHVFPVWSSADTAIELEALGEVERAALAETRTRAGIKPFKKPKESNPEQFAVRMTVSSHDALDGLVQFLKPRDEDQKGDKKDAVNFLKKLGVNRLTVVVKGPVTSLTTQFHLVRGAQTNRFLKWLRIPGPAELVVADPNDTKAWYRFSNHDPEWLLDPAPWAERGEALAKLRATYVRKTFDVDLQALDTGFGDVAKLYAWDLNQMTFTSLDPFASVLFHKGNGELSSSREERPQNHNSVDVTYRSVMAALRFLASHDMVWVDPARTEGQGEKARPTGWMTRAEFDAQWPAEEVLPGLMARANAADPEEAMRRRVVGAVIAAEALGFKDRHARRR